MADQNSENILKVLSGNQYGVEVTLADGTYSFGSGADADIQLLDVALAPVHGQIRLRDGKIEVKASGGDFSTASGLGVSREDSDWREIAQMDAISAGTSKFVIGGAGANWSTLTPAPTPDSRKPAGKLQDMAGALSRMPRRAAYGLGAGVGALALIGILMTSGGDAMPREGAETAVEQLASLRNEVTAMPFAKQVKINARADGSISIEGYVEQAVERRAIQNAVDASNLPATVRIYVLETLRADVAAIIESQKINADFSLDETGNLVLTGTVLDGAQVDRLVESLETGVFGLASLTNDIRTADAFLADLRDLAQKSDLSDLVIFRLDGLVVEATGIVPRDKMDNWVGLIGVYSRRFAEDIPLRSFVTLDEPAASGTAPVIIGQGPATEGENGRILAPEALNEPNELDARSLFAGEAAAGAVAPTAAPLPENLTAAIDRLRLNRPDLYQRLETEVVAGRVPDTALLQESLTALGGILRNTGASENNQPVLEVVIPDLGSLGTLTQITDGFARIIADARAARAAQDAAQAAIIPLPPVDAPAAVAEPAAPVAAEPVAVEPAAEPAAATPLAEDKIDAVPVIPASVEPEAASEAVPAQAPQTTGATEVTAAGVTDQGMPFFAVPESDKLSLGRMIAAADALINENSAAGEVTASRVSPNLFALAQMQRDQLAMGQTLLKMPQPLSASALPVQTAGGCWPNAKLTPELLPTALLLLDVLSVSTEIDVAKIDPELRDIVMETALSPERVRGCITRTESQFGNLVGTSSVFLNETSRNPLFAEFLFRSVPRDTLPIVGANLMGERYIELADGRKLREGAAPDVASRILSIGDSGVLIRSAEGTKAQLYGDALGWRVVDACEVIECEKE